MQKVQDGDTLVDRIVKEQQDNKDTFVFPKKSNQQVVEMDAEYVQRLQILLHMQHERLQYLTRIKSNYAEDQNFKTKLEMADLNVAMWETQCKMRLQEKLVFDKQTHYEKIWLPAYNKELETCAEQWPHALAKAQKITSVECDSIKYPVQTQIDAELNRHKALTEKYGASVEIDNDVYKSVKRLLARWDELSTSV